jgi:L-lactate dehydrogenase (cytochrome)
MVQRRFPKVRDLAPLMQFKKPELNGKKRRLDAAYTIDDLRAIAKRRTPKAAFDYTDGSAESEISLARARQAFQDVEFHPDILRPAVDVDTSCEILGGPSALPFGIAPTGFTRLMQTEGETAGAAAAGAAGIPFTLSTLGTTSIEDVKAANPAGRNWFQLYVMRDREISYGLTRRAAAAGFDTLMFTVDTPIAGARLRDKRNGFSIPPQLTLSTIVNAIPRPWWWIDFLTTPPLEFASLSSTGGTVGDLLDAAMDPTISYEDLAVIRELWPGKIVIKGVQNVEDSKRLIDLGVDGIVLSNHGGRQLDRAPVPFWLLPDVVREVGKDATVMMDTGIMNGADIVAAIALGAKFTLVGRAYLYGLMAGGREGVDKTIDILATQLRRTMRLLGVSSLEELNPSHVTQLTRLMPVPRTATEAADASPTRSRGTTSRSSTAATGTTGGAATSSTSPASATASSSTTRRATVEAPARTRATRTRAAAGATGATAEGATAATVDEKPAKATTGARRGTGAASARSAAATSAASTSRPKTTARKTSTTTAAKTAAPRRTAASASSAASAEGRPESESRAEG